MPAELVQSRQMHWFAYVVAAVAILLAMLAVHFRRRYQLYRRAWEDAHLHDLLQALTVLKAEQLSTLRIVKALPSSFTSDAGVTIGYSIKVADESDRSSAAPEESIDGGGERISHQLVVHSVGFFGQVLAERLLAFSLLRYGFSPEQVELCITAYSFDSFHALIELSAAEHDAWARRPLAPLPCDESALEEAREYREKLGSPRQMLKTIDGLPGAPRRATTAPAG